LWPRLGSLRPEGGQTRCGHRHSTQGSGVSASQAYGGGSPPEASRGANGAVNRRWSSVPVKRPPRPGSAARRRPLLPTLATEIPATSGWSSQWPRTKLPTVVGGAAGRMALPPAVVDVAKLFLCVASVNLLCCNLMLRQLLFCVSSSTSSCC
jgi:hypothetical protein